MSPPREGSLEAPIRHPIDWKTLTITRKKKSLPKWSGFSTFAMAAAGAFLYVIHFPLYLIWLMNQRLSKSMVLPKTTIGKWLMSAISVICVS